MTARRLPFVQVDVFTSRPLEGNAVAVFTDARRLSAAEMQAIARETNLSETTFIVSDPAAPPGTPARVRIFTVGRSSLSLAIRRWERRWCSAAGNASYALARCRRDPRPLRGPPDGTFGEMSQRDPAFGFPLARAGGARDGARARRRRLGRPVQTVSTGIAFTIVPVRTFAALVALRLYLARAEDYLARTGGGFFYFVARETVDPSARLHARMIFYGGEDPATGSTARCCAAWMRRHGIAAPGERVAIEQGLEANRPSRILCARPAKASE